MVVKWYEVKLINDRYNNDYSYQHHVYMLVSFIDGKAGWTQIHANDEPIQYTLTFVWQNAFDTYAWLSINGGDYIQRSKWENCFKWNFKAPPGTVVTVKLKRENNGNDIYYKTETYTVGHSDQEISLKAESQD